MAFKHNANTMMQRYNQHQDHAKRRASGGTGPAFNVSVLSQGKANQTDVANHHGALPKQMTGVNKTQTVQKDINTGTKGANVPKQSPKTSMNRKTLQGDLRGSTSGAHRPGTK